MEHPFDTLARRMGEQRSRRSLLKHAGAGIASVLVGSLLPRGLRHAEAAPCAPGLVACGGGCADILSDPANCGGCGVSAGAGGSCKNGTPVPVRQSTNATPAQPAAGSQPGSTSSNLGPVITLPPSANAPTFENPFGCPAGSIFCTNQQTGGNGAACCGPGTVCGSPSEGPLQCSCADPSFQFCPGATVPVCCPAGATCIGGGRCICHDGSSPCEGGTHCCPELTICQSDQCTPQDCHGQAACGTSPNNLVCCPPLATCQNGQCVCSVSIVQGFTACGQVCCPPQATCANGSCVCPTGNTVCAPGPASGNANAAPVCCGANQACISGACQTCPTGTAPCQQGTDCCCPNGEPPCEGDTVCCGGGSACEQDQCICGDGSPACQKGQVCCPGGSVCQSDQCVCASGTTPSRQLTYDGVEQLTCGCDPPCNPATETCCLDVCLPAGTTTCTGADGLTTSCCAPGETCCPDPTAPHTAICCAAGQGCCVGTCVAAGTTTCHSFNGLTTGCCPPGETCCPDPSQPLAAPCCPAGQTCCGIGCAPIGSTTCHGVDGLTTGCCPPGELCCPDPSRPHTAPCCPAGQECCLGDCVAAGTTICTGANRLTRSCCPPGETCCPDPANPLTANCCPTGQTCQNGACVTPCSATNPCPTGQCCSNDSCVPLSQGGGCSTSGVCGCPSGQTCAAVPSLFAGQCICTNTGKPPVNGQCQAQCSATQAPCPGAANAVNGCCPDPGEPYAAICYTTNGNIPTCGRTCRYTSSTSGGVTVCCSGCNCFGVPGGAACTSPCNANEGCGQLGPQAAGCDCLAGCCGGLKCPPGIIFCPS